MFTTLQAYNLVLASKGDPPIDSLTGSHNQYRVGLIEPHFEMNRLSVLSHGLASNVDIQTLQPDINCNVAVPSDCLRLRFPAGFNHLVVRNGYVWDSTTQTNYASEIRVLVTRDLSFETLDDLTQLWIINLTCRDYRMRATSEYDGKAAFYDREAAAFKMRAMNKDSYSSINMNGWGRTISVYGG